MITDLRILWRFIHIACHQLAYYRANLFAVLGYWCISLGILVVFWQALFQFLPSALGDWDFPRLCLLNALCYISWGLFVFFWGLHQIPQKVIRGELDKFLARPISPLLGLVGEEIHMEAVYEIFAGILGTVLLTAHFDLWPSLSAMCGSMAMILCGTLILVLFHGSLSLTSFWVGRIESLQHIVDTMDEFQKYPLIFFPNPVRWVLMFLVPLYYPGSFAARLYLGLPIPTHHWLTLIVTGISWALLFGILYQRCLRRYEANG